MADHNATHAIRGVLVIPWLALTFIVEIHHIIIRGTPPECLPAAYAMLSGRRVGVVNIP